MGFPYSRTSDQIDRGLDMRYHPMCGKQLMDLSWDSQCQQYFDQKMVSAGGWAFAEPGETTYFSRVGDGNDHEKGEPYLAHWLYHPVTGDKL